MKEYFGNEEKKIQSKVRLRVKKLRTDNNKTQEEIGNLFKNINKDISVKIAKEIKNFHQNFL